MEPTFKNGNVVLVSSFPYIFSKPKIGDIVAFKKENKVLIKRISKIKDNEYFLSGDNSKDSIDGWTDKSKIKGKVIYVITR